jgi:hypothetical protein
MAAFAGPKIAKLFQESMSSLESSKDGFYCYAVWPDRLVFYATISAVVAV